MADSTTFACLHLCLSLFAHSLLLSSGSYAPVHVGKFKPFPYHVFGSMAPVMRVEPNGNQSLLMFDNARQDLEDNGWLPFLQ
jgi:hypothetical protein